MLAPLNCFNTYASFALAYSQNYLSTAKNEHSLTGSFGALARCAISALHSIYSV